MDPPSSRKQIKRDPDDDEEYSPPQKPPQMTRKPATPISKGTRRRSSRRFGSSSRFSTPIASPESSALVRSMKSCDGTVKNSKKDFDNLPLPRRQQRLNRISYIETAWGEPLADCLPEEIRPRKQHGPYTKAQLNDLAATELENDPRNWSDHFLNNLQTLSALTENKLRDAQDLLLKIVKERQGEDPSDKRSTRHQYAAELIIGDVKRAIELLKESKGIHGLKRKLQIVPTTSGTSSSLSKKKPCTPNKNGAADKKNKTKSRMAYNRLGDTQFGDDDFAAASFAANGSDDSFYSGDGSEGMDVVSPESLQSPQSYHSPPKRPVFMSRNASMHTFDTPTPVHYHDATADLPGDIYSRSPPLGSDDDRNNNNHHHHHHHHHHNGSPGIAVHSLHHMPGNLANQSLASQSLALIVPTAPPPMPFHQYDSSLSSAHSGPTLLDPPLGAPAHTTGPQPHQPSSFHSVATGSTTALAVAPGAAAEQARSVAALRRLVAEQERLAASHRQSASQMRRAAALEDFRCAEARSRADDLRKQIVDLQQIELDL